LVLTPDQARFSATLIRRQFSPIATICERDNGTRK
jgi:hypothetical protein